MKFLSGLSFAFTRFASFFDEQKVEEFDSEVNDKLEVVWVNGAKVLNVANANYSFGSLYKTFRKTFQAVAIEKENFDKVLILGNAAGGTAHLLRHEYYFEGEIHGVELDKKIIEVAQKHFPQGYAATNKIYNEDGYNFVMNLENEVYDFVVFDIYHDLEIPDKFHTQFFIKSLHRIMKNDSILIFNKVVRSRKTLQEAGFLEAVMKQQFSDFRKIILGNITENRMFVCRKLS